MERKISPVERLSGTVRPPGDKSVSHRYAMLASLAEGPSEITNYSSGADCASTLACMQALGVELEQEGDRVRIEGAGLSGLQAPQAQLDAGNSGSTIRMLSGILAGQSFTSVIAGDESLAQRPMKRVMTPLMQMGARITAREGEYPPLEITGGALHPIEYEPPVASAQVKTAVLFAGMFADGVTSVREKLPTRNHSEIALRRFGAKVEANGLLVSIHGRPKLKGQDLRVPSDLSSAAFFIAAGLLLPGSEVRIEGVGLNPSRTALLDVLQSMGAAIDVRPDSNAEGEPTGTLVVHGPPRAGEAPLKGGEIEGATTAAVIDEIPVLAVLGAASEEGLLIRDAAELRVKESDRITTILDNLQRMGVEGAEFEDGMNIPGSQQFKGAELDSFGDHRIAMAFAVAALAAKGESEMANAEAASVSFPEFYDMLDSLR